MALLPFLGTLRILGFLMDTLLFLALVAGVWSMDAGRVVKLSVVIIGVSVLGETFFHIADRGGGLLVARLVLQSAALLVVTLSIMKDVLTGGEVDSNRVMGSACIYLLLGIIWSSLYTVVEVLFPGSFTLAGQALAEKRFDLWYFSMVTLTTLGYGDIAPISPIAKSLAVVEAVTGQLILVILVARTVGLHTALSPGREDR
jgi:hypothetical protein